MKRKLTLFIIILLFFIAKIGLSYINNNQDSEYIHFDNVKILKIYSYEDYLRNKNIVDSIKDKTKITEKDFEKYNYVVLTYTIDSCSEKIEDRYYKNKNNHLSFYYDIARSCGVCAPLERSDVYRIDKHHFKEDIRIFYRITSNQECDPNIVYKPMIYIYPKEDIDLTIKLGNEDLLTSSYPKYNNYWNVHISKDGNIYDYDTKRNYYGLYWEAQDYTILDMSEGFVVKGSDTVQFLEEKLSILGLNDYEINEFIVYWISKLENNNYNFIRFRSLEEINEYMPLYFSKKPDTLIRVIMDFKPLDNKIEVKEQELSKVNRNGFTIVEWGGAKR